MRFGSPNSVGERLSAGDARLSGGDRRGDGVALGEGDGEDVSIVCGRRGIGRRRGRSEEVDII